MKKPTKLRTHLFSPPEGYLAALNQFILEARQPPDTAGMPPQPEPNPERADH